MRTKLTLKIAAVLSVAPLTAGGQLVADGATSVINGVGTNLIGALIVGNNGSFTTLVITNAGAVTNTGTGSIGETSLARTNRVIVTGTNSVWANGTTLAIGRNGQFNELLVTNGGLVRNTFGNLGANSAGSSNRVVVTGAGSLWSCSETVNVGNSAPHNLLLVTNGGRVNALLGRLGNASAGNLALVTGSGSSWTTASGLFVGDATSFNQLVVSDGGGVLSGGAYVGGNFMQSGSGRSNTVVIAGAGSTWTNTSTSSVGNFGDHNRLILTNGGVMRNTAAFADLVLGWQLSGSNNALTVTGPGSLFSNRGTTAGVIVGQGGSFNELLVNAGGVVEGDIGSLGYNGPSSNNVAVIADAGSQWDNDLAFYVGRSGSGNQVLITNGGLVRAPAVYVGSNPGSSNNMLWIEGGSLIVTNLAHNAVLDVRRGSNVLQSGWIQADRLLLTNLASRLIFNGGTLSVDASRVSHGTLFRIGDGTHPATMILAGNGVHDFTGTLAAIVSPNATLTGNGAIGGLLVVASGAQLAPGSSIGKMIVSNTPTLQGVVRMEISKDGVALTNDQIEVHAALTYGGSLVVSNLGPTALAAGDSFKLFSAVSYAGAFSGLELPVLGPGLLWTNKLLADGSVEVYAVPAREPGVDVSHYQGETGVSQAGWNQMFAEGKRFAFIKATEGLSVLDAAMANNADRATAAGLRAGVYHFAHPELRPTTNGAVQEADYLLAYAGNYVGPGYLRPVLDLEAGSILTTTELTDWVIAFAEEIVAHRGPGAAPVIYCSQFYANIELDSRLANYDLWLRTITALDPATNEPPIVSFADPTGVFNNWSFWQYSDTGSSGGISPLDLNICHSEFKPLNSFLIPAVANPVPPVITGEPQSRTVTVSNNASFTVTVAVSSSTPLYYQWRLGGTNLAGATARSLTVTNAQFSDAGEYTVVITNAADSVTSAVALLTVTPPQPPFQGIALYEENFDGYVSPSVVTAAGTTNGFKVFYGAASGPSDFTAQFGFDYSTVVSPATIPAAPYSTNGTTRGLSLTVNKDASGAAAALNLYPLSQTFTGSVALKFDLWINFPNTSTATEHALFGINHSAEVTNRVGQATSDGLFFAVSSDGQVSSGSATLRDYAVFRGGEDGTIPVLLTTDNTDFGPEPLLGVNFDSADAGFGALFPPKALPSFTTPAGAAGNRWVSVEVRQQTNLLTWVLNDVIVAQYTNTSAFTNGNILIGYNDAFTSIGGADNFAVFDNLRVETAVPDYDQDGLADAWEIVYFGNLAAQPEDDLDGDGVSALHESLAGTNPTNAASALRMLSAEPANNDILLTWATVGGRSYVVQRATNDTAGLTAAFVDLSPVIVAGGTNEAATNYLHTGGATNPAGYYRVRLEP
ncbi:MAG TPA: GH25 family lysozyme [Candidatus Paceibacterota bacterium]|nr:GH25 family lysozyme [Verrucomicrobiota bacterium]HSA10974.1 GH25 family lysozyme [Candidatus Paceibacterota bacterium]